MNRSKHAIQLKHGGMNCCQSVLLAYGDRTSLSEDELKSIGAAFGIGMGTFESTCGALCGVQMLLGLAKYSGKPITRDARGVLEQFKAKTGSSRCWELKGRDTGVVLCDCEDCIRAACDIAEEIFFGKKESSEG